MKEENIGKGIGILGLMVGIVVALTPFNLAKVCTKTLEVKNAMQGAMGGMSATMNSLTVPMKCNFMGSSEIFLGLLVAFIGLLLILTRNGQRNLFPVLGVLGLMIILMPTGIGIGICSNPEMACHTTKSFLTVSGTVLIVASLIGLFVRKSRN